MRKVLQEGTWIRLSQGELYKITGTPVGEGGGSIVYPCKKISHFNGKITVSEIDYALKECFPLSSAFVFERREDGEIVSATENPAEELKHITAICQKNADAGAGNNRKNLQYRG